jgi:hypothetical protein
MVKTENIDVTIREKDFVSSFTKNWKALMDILGIMRPIKKEAGTQLVSYNTSVTLANGTVAEGETIPESTVNITEAFKEDIDLQKYKKSVTAEAVTRYGADIAVVKSDEAFKNELQNKVLTDFYTFLRTGELTFSTTGLQKALALAKGKVLAKFQAARLTVTDVVGFANTNDVYAYLGDAAITVQTQFGMTYIENFLGYKVLFLCPDADIPQGKVIALPVENIDLYYIDPSTEFAKLGLVYTVDGETNLIGFHAEPKYDNATGASYATMGLKLWAEYLDGIAIGTFPVSTEGGSENTGA